MSDASRLRIAVDGKINAIHHDSIAWKNFGAVSIERASYVEPTAAGDWIVDLSPVGGPTLGPFMTRSEGLAEELYWLEQHWLMSSPVRFDRGA